VRDRTATKAEIEAAIEAARREFVLAMKYAGFPNKSADEPPSDFSLRYYTHHIIEKLPEEVLSSESRDYLCKILSEPPKGLKHTYTERDGRIAEVLGMIEGLGFPPTRNDTTRAREKAGEPANQSACSIVMKALARLGVHMSERTVEDIWARDVREKRKWTEKSGVSPGK
jgi:hypothetical protein